MSAARAIAQRGRSFGLWWTDLIKRQGVATALVFVYLFAVVIPESRDRQAESRDRRTALQSQVAMTAHVATLVDQVVACEKGQAIWQENWEKTVTAQHASRAAEHDRILKATDEILRVAKLKPASE